VLQLYVCLSNPADAGTFALASIGISALTTGYTSAMIAFDMDVDLPHRKNQPNFYGFIPDDNGSRSRCFTLMTWIGALHNLSRSVGCALLAASPGGGKVLLAFVGIEMLVYLAFKTARGDFYYWPRLDGAMAFILSFLTRMVVKVVVDFRYVRCARL